jgi:competence protein ComEA
MNVLPKFVSTCLLCLAIGAADAEVIDINTADASSLAVTIIGIGPARAEAIVAFRKANGPFAEIDDLVLVKGIGSATVDKNRDKLTAVKP